MKLYQLLVESRIDFLKDKYIPLIKDKTNSNEGYSMTMFHLITDIDPTNNKIYLQWLLNNILKLNVNNFFTTIREDAYKWKEYLTIYHKVKNKLPLQQRDINKLNLNDLKDIALQYKEKEDEVGTKNEVLDKKYKIAENNEYFVYMFKSATQQDFKMYQLVSTNTEWCTRPNYDTFKNYVNRSPLFIFINKNNREEKYQFHERSSQFMDKNDEEIDDKLLIYFIKLIDKYLPEDFILKIIIDNLWGFIDKKGNIIAKGFKFAYSFYEGFAWVKFQDNSYGYIDKKGNIIAKGFKEAWSFYEGFAKVKFQDDSYGYIDNKGNIYEDDKKTLINKNDPRLKAVEIYPDKFI